MSHPPSSSAAAGLSEDDLLTWAAFATVLEWLPAALDAALLASFQLTHFEYGIVFALANAEGQVLQMTALAGFANSSLSRLSRAVTRLEGRGWVTRGKNPSDGRSTIVRLTPRGHAMQVAAEPAHTRRVTELVLDPLSASQRRQLREISVAIQRAVRAAPGWVPHPSTGGDFA